MTTVQLTVWVRQRGDTTWKQCPEIRPLLGEEPIKGPAEVSAVLRAQGCLVNRLLSAVQRPYGAFRILARTKPSRTLVGVTEWHASAETGLMSPAEGYPWADALSQT